MKGNERRNPEGRVVEYLNALLEDAVAQGASDVHLTPGESRFSLSLRTDGRLYVQDVPEDAPPYEELISRIKVLAGMNIAQRQLPQDGHFRHTAGGRAIDFRAAVMPTIDGESAVLRVFDRNRRSFSLATLGMSSRERRRLKEAVERPSGMVLVSGPIGSGKTTTLYAILQELAEKGKKIMTIEDPVEVRIPDAAQVEVNEAHGLDFAQGLKSMVRHDPDVIMVGEIRDAETARTAVQAAVLGHLVLATIHAESSVLAVERLLHLDVDRYELAVAFNCILSQRLIPRANATGRSGIFDVFVPDEIFKRDVLSSDGLLREYGDGLRQAGLRKVRTGEITRRALDGVLPSAGRPKHFESAIPTFELLEDGGRETEGEEGLTKATVFFDGVAAREALRKMKRRQRHWTEGALCKEALQ